MPASPTLSSSSLPPPAPLPPPPTAEMLAALAESSTFVVVVDAAGCVTFLNAAALALTGSASTDQILGQPLEACFPLREAGLDPAAATVRRALATGAAQRFAPRTTVLLPPSDTEIVLIPAPDPSELPVAGSVTPWRDASGQVAGALLLLHDLCEHQRAERENAHVTRQEALAALAGRVAHDFNNTLTVVLGNLALAQRALAPEQESQRLRLLETERGCQRAVDLLRDLLGFATQAPGATGAGGGERQLVAVATFVADCAERVERETGVPCLLHWPAAGPGSLPSIQADPAALRRLLDELFLNAIHAVSLDRPETVLHARGEVVSLDGRSVLPLPPGEYLRLTLRDPGMGISLSDWTRVFEPFFTTQSHTRGLGLAAAWRVARAHGGYLFIDDSAPGVGTTMALLLPVASATADAPLMPAAPTATSSAPCAGRVLVMDDEQSIRDLTSSVLGQFGYAVDAAQEGGEAVEKYVAARAAGQPFDAVFLDLAVRRGGLDGKTTAERLRAVDPKARLIVLTGHISDPALSRYRDFGFSGRVRKPFGVSELIRELESVLGK